MRRTKLKTRKWIKPKISTIISVIVLFICFFCVKILLFLNQEITPKLIEIASKNIEKLTYNIFNDYSLLEKFDQQLYDNLYTVYKNKNDEIINVNYNIKTAYQMLQILAQNIKNDFNAIENGTLNLDYYDEELSNGTNGFILSMPIGVASNNIYITNLGPKIPVKIKFIGTLLTNLKTRVQNYGINNALIEINMDISLQHEIITPVTFQTKDLKYEILLSAQIINGTVPSLYGGVYETKSNILNVPIN